MQLVYWTHSQWQAKELLLTTSRSLTKAVLHSVRQGLPSHDLSYFHVTQGVTPPNWRVLDDASVDLAKLPEQ